MAMDGLADSIERHEAIEAVRRLERELQSSVHVLAAVVQSAGGEVLVHKKTLQRNLVLEREDDPFDGRILFRSTEPT